MNFERIKKDKELGKRIFESVPNSLTPGWATSLLMTFDKLLKVPVEVKELYEIVEDEKRWKEAHKQFTKIREFGLENKRFKPEAYLLLAEKVSKVTYNLSGEPAPFDKDSGWYIPSLSLLTAESLGNKEIRDEILRILTLHNNIDINS